MDLVCLCVSSCEASVFVYVCVRVCLFVCCLQSELLFEFVLFCECVFP